jgi:hypothetical protein
VGPSGYSTTKAYFHTITPFVKKVKERFPTMGAQQLVATLRQDYRLKVSVFFLHTLT